MLPPLHEWEAFYVITGSPAAALTGLKSVVIALGAEPMSMGGEAELQAFATPTVAHFCMVLPVSAIISTPRHTQVTRRRDGAQGTQADERAGDCDKGVSAVYDAIDCATSASPSVSCACGCAT